VPSKAGRSRASGYAATFATNACNAARAPSSPGVQCDQNGRSHVGDGAGKQCIDRLASIVTGGNRAGASKVCGVRITAAAAFQNGVKTLYGSPAFVATSHGSISSAPLWLCAKSPERRKVRFNAVSRCFDRRFVTSRPEHRLGLRVAREFFERSLRRPAHAHQARTTRAQDASSATNDRRRHASDAAPGAQSPSSAGACTYTGTGA
jgi:hypothetical protein